MVLIDTNVWIDFFKGQKRAEPLISLLHDDAVLLHPYVKGELLLGGILDAASNLLDSLRKAEIVAEDDIYSFIRHHGLWGSGVGWVDVNLLSSAVLSGCGIFTFDEKLSEQADKLGCRHVT